MRAVARAGDRPQRCVAQWPGRRVDTRRWGPGELSRLVANTAPMARRAYRIAYDGTTFKGFQRQPDVPTVEDALFAAFAALDVRRPDEPPSGYAAAGRTDAGVSAVAQTVALDAPSWLTPAALNADLPDDVRAWAAADAGPDFQATRRTYEYHWHAPEADADRARRACDRLTGTHDFHNLTPDDRGTTRRLSVSLRVDGSYVVVTLAAPGFARQLARRVVSLVADVATGQREVPFVDRVLDADPLNGPAGIAPAPPEPLVLTDVAYPDLAFTADDRAQADARTVFEARRVERRTGARIAASVRDGLSGER